MAVLLFAADVITADQCLVVVGVFGAGATAALRAGQKADEASIQTARAASLQALVELLLRSEKETEQSSTKADE